MSEDLLREIAREEIRNYFRPKCTKVETLPEWPEEGMAYWIADRAQAEAFGCDILYREGGKWLPIAPGVYAADQEDEK